MDLARAFSELKSLPDVALKKELASPSGAIPGFMVLGELHERKAMRAGAGGSPDATIKRKSMAEEYMGDIKSMMPSSMQGLQPTQAMPPQAVPPPQTASPMGGGIASIPGYASGGKVDLQKAILDDELRDVMREIRDERHDKFSSALHAGDYEDAERQADRWKYDDPEYSQRMVRDMQGLRQNSLMEKKWPKPGWGTPQEPDPVWRDTSSGMSNNPLRAILNYITKPAYAGGGIVSLAGGGPVDLETYARQRAALRGVDPDMFVRVIMQEGGFHDTPIQSRARNAAGILEPSYGSLQMLIGGPGTGYGTGVGNAALAAGIDPRKAEDQYRAIDFGLEHIVNNGWGAWSGAKKIGITGMMGVNGNPGVAPETMLGAAGNAEVAATAAETAGNMATAETAAATADPMSSYLLMQQLMQQASPTVQPAELPAPVAPQPIGDYREFAQATSMRPDYFERLRNG